MIHGEKFYASRKDFFHPVSTNVINIFVRTFITSQNMVGNYALKSSTAISKYDLYFELGGSGQNLIETETESYFELQGTMNCLVDLKDWI